MTFILIKITTLISLEKEVNNHETIDEDTALKKDIIQILKNNYPNFKKCYDYSIGFADKCNDNIFFLRYILLSESFKLINVDYKNNREFKRLYKKNQIFEELFETNEVFRNAYVNSKDLQQKLLEDPDFLNNYDTNRDLILYINNLGDLGSNAFDNLMKNNKLKELFDKSEKFRSIFDYKYFIEKCGLLCSIYDLSPKKIKKLTNKCYRNFKKSNLKNSSMVNPKFYFLNYIYPELKKLYNKCNNPKKLKSLLKYNDMFIILFYFNYEFRNNVIYNNQFLDSLNNIIICFYYYYHNNDYMRILYDNCDEFKLLCHNKIKEQKTAFFSDQSIKDNYNVIVKIKEATILKDKAFKAIFDTPEFNKLYNNSKNCMFQQLFIFSYEFRYNLLSNYNTVINLHINNSVSNLYYLKYYYNLYLYPQCRILFNNSEKFRELHYVSLDNDVNLDFVFLYNNNKLFREICYFNQDFIDQCHNIFNDIKNNTICNDKNSDILIYFYYTIDPQYKKLYDNIEKNIQSEYLFSGQFARLYNEFISFRINHNNQEFRNKLINEKYFMKKQFLKYCYKDLQDNFLLQILINNDNFLERYYASIFDFKKLNINEKIKIFNEFIDKKEKIFIDFENNKEYNEENLLNNIITHDIIDYKEKVLIDYDTKKYNNKLLFDKININS